MVLIWKFLTKTLISGELYKDRVNVSGNAEISDASITIGQLTMEDNGTYECSVSLMEDLGGTPKSRVQLLVLGECLHLFPGLSWASRAVVQGGVQGGGAPWWSGKARFPQGFPFYSELCPPRTVPRAEEKACLEWPRGQPGKFCPCSVQCPSPCPKLSSFSRRAY